MSYRFVLRHLQLCVIIKYNDWLEPIDRNVASGSTPLPLCGKWGCITKTEESGWQIIGRVPEAYEQYIVRAWMRTWAEVLVESAGAKHGKRVFDVACGTGVVARKAAEVVGAGGRVTGTDMNEGMIRSASHFAERAGMPRRR